MPGASICPQCGAPLPGKGWEGLCPKCLVRVSLALSGSRPAADKLEPQSRDLKIQHREPRRFGDYELLEEIGRGGMGVVYRARQISLNRPVAVKMIATGELASPEFVQRFHLEAEAAAGLQHPNIVAIHEVGAHEGQHFYSMDYVEGQTLAERALNNPLPPEQATDCLKTIAEAVHYAHQRGILHRDLKPSNVLIDSLDQPHLTDFGLAKRLSGDSELTLTGQVLGSPNYMPPEQALGQRQAATIACDVYSLGALLYFLLTGRPPFAAGSVTETLQQVLHSEPVSPQLLNQGAPRDLETICLKCLSKEPRGRYGSAQELAQDLGRFLKGEPVQARPIGAAGKAWRWCRRNPKVATLAGVSAVLLLAVAIGSPIAALRINRESTLAKQNAAESRSRLVRQYVANGNRLVDEGDLFGALPWFAQALKEEEDPARAEIHRLRFASTLLQCPKLVQMWFPQQRLACFSPDGNRVVTATLDGTARVWDATSGQPVSPVLHNGWTIFSVAFSPDGRYVATASGAGTVGVWEVTTGRLLFPFLQHENPISYVEFSLDGLRLLTGAQDNTAQVWDAATGVKIGRAMRHDDYVGATFSRDGRRVVTWSTDATARIWDANTGEPTSPPLQHEKQVGGRAQFSPDGKLVVTGSWDGTARLWDAETGKQVAVLRHQGYVRSVAFSPDGRLLVTASHDETAVVWEVATAAPAAPTLRHNGPVSAASFSADGKYVLTASHDGTARVWDWATGKLVGPPLRHGSALEQASFSPDGRRVLTASGQGLTMLEGLGDGVVRIWDLAGGEPVIAMAKHPTVVHAASFTLDSQQVSTVSLDGTAYLWDARTGRVLSATWTNLEPGAPHGFTADGRAFVQAVTNGTATVLDFNSGRPVLLALRHEGRINHAQCSPDGSRMVTASEDHTARVWDTLTGKPVAPPLVHEGSVHFAAFSPDNRLIVTASSDRTARVWEAATGEPVTPPLKHNGMVHRAFFSPDGQRILTTASDGKARVWVLPMEKRSVDDCVLLARLLAAHEIDVTGAYVPVPGERLAAAWLTLQSNNSSAFTVMEEQVLVRQQRDIEAIARARALSQWRQCWSQAVGFAKSNQWTDAVAAFSRAIELDPHDPALFDGRQDCYAQLQRFREAIRDCNEYLWRWQAGDWHNSFDRSFGLRGQYHLALGEQEQAIADFQKAFDLRPGRFNEYYRLFSARDQPRQFRDAVGALAKAVERSAQNTKDKACSSLAWFYVTGPTNLRSPEKALPLALRAVELGKTNHDEFNTLGVVYYRLGQLTNAIATLETGIKADAEGGSAHDFFFLAMAYQRLGNIAKGRDCYVKALKWLQGQSGLSSEDKTDLDNFRAEAEEVLGRDTERTGD